MEKHKLLNLDKHTKVILNLKPTPNFKNCSCVSHTHTHTHFFQDIWVSLCQKKASSGLYGATGHIGGRHTNNRARHHFIHTNQRPGLGQAPNMLACIQWQWLCSYPVSWLDYHRRSNDVYWRGGTWFFSTDVSDIGMTGTVYKLLHSLLQHTIYIHCCFYTTILHLQDCITESLKSKMNQGHITSWSPHQPSLLLLVFPSHVIYGDMHVLL